LPEEIVSTANVPRHFLRVSEEAYVLLQGLNSERDALGFNVRLAKI